MIISVALSFFNRKTGPLVFYSYPLELEKNLSIQIANLMEKSKVTNGFVYYSFEKSRSINLFFEIHSGGTPPKMSMISVILDSTDPRSTTSEIEEKISALLVEFTEKLKSEENVFKALYIGGIYMGGV